MKRDLDLLTSPAFVAGLLLLVANDFLLKPAFHNAVTGKLSDFAGLFVFPLFWTALAPRRRREIYALTALGFVFWKSAYAQPLIDGWNALGVLRVGRVVDPTDLSALAALPASFAYLRRRLAREGRPANFALRRAAACAVLLLSVFAFTATQMADEQTASYWLEYQFKVSREELVSLLSSLEPRGVRVSKLEYLGPDNYRVHINSKFCKSGVAAFVEAYARADLSVLELKWIEYYCDEKRPEHGEQLLALFEREVIARLPPSARAAREPRTPPPTPRTSTPPAGGGKMPGRTPRG